MLGWGIVWSGTLGLLHIAQNTPTQPLVAVEMSTTSNSIPAVQILEGDYKKPDLSTLESVGNSFSKDKDTIYYQAGETYGYIALPYLDKNSFVVDSRVDFNNINTWFYLKDRSSVYLFRPYGEELKDCNANVTQDLREGLIEEGNFTSISTFLYDGGTKGYCIVFWGKKLEGADPKTFTVVKYLNKPTEYSKDVQFVYDDSGHIMKDLDASTFVALRKTGGYSNYIKDKNSVYYTTWQDIKKVQGADVETFLLVENSSQLDAQDKNHKYLGGKVICEDLTQISCKFEYGQGSGTEGHWFQIVP